MARHSERVADPPFPRQVRKTCRLYGIWPSRRKPGDLPAREICCRISRLRRIRNAATAAGRPATPDSLYTFAHASQILAPLRAGLHAVPRGAVRGASRCARTCCRARSGRAGSVIVTQETATPVAATRVASYADAAKKAMPAVVNIYTSKEVRSRNPLADDPLFRRYFPELDRGAAQRQTSLGSGVIVVAGGLRAHQPPRDRRAPTTSSSCSPTAAACAARVRGTDPESDLAVLKADADEPARRSRSASSDNAAGRRRRARDRQSVRPRQHGDARASSARSGATTSASTASRTSSRPTRRSIPATRAAR